MPEIAEQHLREALERIAEPSGVDPVHREYPTVKRLQAMAREALATCPEPVYEWRVAYEDGSSWSAIVALESSARRCLSYALESEAANLRLQRRVVTAPGEWEDVPE